MLMNGVRAGRKSTLLRKQCANILKPNGEYTYLLFLQPASDHIRFWWLDLNTFIMEPSYSLQSHIFNNLGKNVYRDINVYNPLNISHPFTDPYLDPISLSPVGDGEDSSINLVISQDCGGFNLGSFFIKRSAWTDRL